MAVSGKTAAPHEIPFFLASDSPPDMGDVTEAMANRIHSRLNSIATSQLVVPGGEADDGKLLIVKDGAAAYRAMKGDATIDEDGNLQLGAKVVGTPELGDKAVTTAKLDDGAVTLTKLAAGLGLSSESLADGAATSRKTKPTCGVVRASEAIALVSGAAYVDMPGTTLEITPEVKSTLLVVATFSFQLEGIGATTLGTLSLDGVDQGAVAGRGNGGPAAYLEEDMATQVYALTLSAAKHTIKMRVKGSGSGLAATIRCGFLYVLVAA